MKKINAIAIIPARGGSKRLPRKNIYPLMGRPLIYYAIEACKKAESISRVFVSTEDKAIKRTAKKFGVEIIDRPEHLAADNIWTQDVLKHAVLDLAERGVKFDIVARIQANSPMVESKKIDEGVKMLVKNNLWEIFSVDQSGLEDGAIHILRKNIVFQNALSVYKGVIFTDYFDVHILEDIKTIEKLWKNQSGI